ncbi:SCO family protein [Polaribacter pectinis]|uniref:SCO family protein n=1 Tax=Polaribacter pectinis TaxID=2738844 RepID=A0A7G9L823_9FLAO|nr:SCO family protein [Polaribacter pectinis]QNM84772.1 SCO family protein [Polaribacter pectinis]
MSFKNTFFINILIILIFSSCDSSDIKLPIISKAFVETENVSEVKKMSFKSQLNEEFPIYSLKGKIHLVNFFFASCTAICPVMESNLKDVVLANENIPLLSFTIDPERDTFSVLKEHHRIVAENATNWLFLRGNKSDLKKIAKLYLSHISNDGDDDSYFYHTSSVVLLDKEMRIRGIYDSLDEVEIKLLKRDIAILFNE